MYGGGVMTGWRAGSCFGKYIAESPKQDSKRFNSITKTIHFAHLGILFIYGMQSSLPDRHDEASARYSIASPYHILLYRT